MGFLLGLGRAGSRAGKPRTVTGGAGRAALRFLAGTSAVAVSMIMVGSSASWAASCAGTESAHSTQLIPALEALQIGNYTSFVDAIDPEQTLSEEKRLHLSTGLGEISTTGFDSCSILIGRVDANSVQIVAILRQDERHLFTYFLLGMLDGDWMFLKTQVSTDIDEILGLVR